MVAGIMLGPSLIGRISPEAMQFVLPADVVLDLCLAELQRRDPATYGRPSRIATSRVDRIAL